jgi:hypothetical protein
VPDAGDRAADDDHDHAEGRGVTMAALAHVLVLAAEEGPTAHNIWNPTILGILTVLCAVGLFCGSAYLLLGTNLGGRLGFLVAAAGLTGFLVLLTGLWWTSGNSGIDPPHGRSPTWNVVEVVTDPAASKFKAIQNVAQKECFGANATSEVCSRARLTEDQLTNLKPAIDGAIIPATSVNGETPPTRKFATLGFAATTDYLVDFEGYRSYEEGGGNRNVFWHTPQYAAVQLCAAAKDDTGQVITPARCDPLQPTHYVVLRKDLGTLRQPVVLYFFMTLGLFALSLLGLHWYEQDQRERKRAGLTPVPTPGA